MLSSCFYFVPYHVSLRWTTASTWTAALRRKRYTFPEVFFLYSKLIFPLDPNDSVLLEIPVIISQGVSQKYRLALDDLIYVEACQHRLILHTIQGDFTTRCTFADLTVCLTPSDRFFPRRKRSADQLCPRFPCTGNWRSSAEKWADHFLQPPAEAWDPGSLPGLRRSRKVFLRNDIKKQEGCARRKISTKYRFCSVFASCDSLSC